MAMPEFMSLDAARDVLQRRNRGERLDPVQVTAASTRVWVEDERQRQRDPKRRLTLDWGRPTLPTKDYAGYRETMREGNNTEMGRAPSTEVGPRRIMRLDGPASAYVIVSTADGETWLCLAGQIGGALNPGGAVTGASQKFTADALQHRRIAMARAAAEQQRSRSWAADIAEFWQGQASARG
jgi:hypothetical protein